MSSCPRIRQADDFSGFFAVRSPTYQVSKRRERNRAFLNKVRTEQLAADWRSERQLETFLSKHGVSFDRQTVFLFKGGGRRIGAVVDFYLPSHRVVIEVDGPCHDDKAELDQERDKLLLKRGDVERVIRIPARASHERMTEALREFFPQPTVTKRKVTVSHPISTKVKKPPKVRARTRYLLDLEARAGQRRQERMRRRAETERSRREAEPPVTRLPTVGSVFCRRPLPIG